MVLDRGIIVRSENPTTLKIFLYCALQDVNHIDVHCHPLQVTTQKIPIQKVKKGRSRSSEKGIHSPTGTPLDEAAKHILPKVRSYTKKKVTFGKEWEAFMKERIREDNELNLRVIRYEVGCSLILNSFLIMIVSRWILVYF